MAQAGNLELDSRDFMKDVTLNVSVTHAKQMEYRIKAACFLIKTAAFIMGAGVSLTVAPSPEVISPRDIER